MDASDDGFWDWIVADDTIYTSPRLLEIYGLAPGTISPAATTFSRGCRSTPRTARLLMRAFAEHLAGKTARYDVEARFIRDGETRWVQLVGMAARDPSGAVVRWTGTVRDVTERKRAEEALRESEQRYARVVTRATRRSGIGKLPATSTTSRLGSSRYSTSRRVRPSAAGRLVQ